MIFEFDLPTNKKRLDVEVTRLLQESGLEITRSEITKAFSEKRICLADGSVPKSGLKLDRPYHVQIEILDKIVNNHVGEDIELDIVYEDDYLIVINKQKGLVVHPAPGHNSGTLVNALLYRYGQGRLSTINGEFRPGIVHRIDKDTSGLLVVAKNNHVHHLLAKLLAKHEIRRVYNAIVFGNFAEEKGRVEAPIARDPRNRQKMAVVAGGKDAVTHFEILENLAGYTLLRLALETGRTHQIRVHMQYIGHPVVGDPLYASGRKKFDLPGQMLHAAELHFVHPITSEQIDCYAPLPAVFNEFLQLYR